MVGGGRGSWRRKKGCVDESLMEDGDGGGTVMNRGRDSGMKESEERI